MSSAIGMNCDHLLAGRASVNHQHDLPGRQDSLGAPCFSDAVFLKKGSFSLGSATSGRVV